MVLSLSRGVSMSLVFRNDSRVNTTEFRTVDILHQAMLIAMPLLVEQASCRSSDFPNQRQAHMLRKGKKLSWKQIAQRVVNLAGNHPSWPTVRRIVKDLNMRRGVDALVLRGLQNVTWKR